MKNILGCLRRADEKFNMIEDGDVVAVGLSGGKDSAVMLHALSLYKRFSKKKYELVAVCVNLGFEGFNKELLQDMCDKLEVKLSIVDTEIGKIVFDVRQEKNPCALCANLRKGAFYKEAKRLNATKAVFAHHRDDVVETFFMSMLYESRLNVFRPVTYLSRADITLIRPFIYVDEQHIKKVVEKIGVPVIKNACPSCGNTKREEIKQLFDKLNGTYPGIRERVMTAIDGTDNYKLWDKMGE